ncbi:hypothetical protein [Massilia sp. CFBP9026]|uniref:hypothetical protein n=1 Tax=Massilia sp. CFBP9026 TaxID=3096536 RepID=UPI002A6A7B64|nr:hypothetical protein [Massilia sp. CFBP9026]MDY0961756.1 hypothetical protein [Massilia sp. CFBP9026]
MSMAAMHYRHLMVRAVTGNRPALVFHVTDGAAIDSLCERLVDAERAFEILRAKGYGKPGMLLHDVAALVPPAD